MIEKMTFNEGDILCSEGKLEDFMYDIISGEVAIYKDLGLKTERQIAVINSGFVGEMGMIDNFPRTASVVAISDTRAVRIDSAGLDEYLSDNPAKCLKLLKMLSSRLRDTDKKYLAACQTISDYLDGPEQKDGIIARMQEYKDILAQRGL